MTPTTEQEAIFSFIKDEKKNLLVTARAGAAKTTTIEMAISRERKAATYLAFNKATVIEAKQRVPSLCEVFTLNGLGHRAWGRYTGKRLKIDSSKIYKLMKEMDYKGDNFKEMLRACTIAKMQGYVPEGLYPKKPKHIIDKENFYDGYNFEFTPDEQFIIDITLEQSLNQAFEGLIDFNDQILCSAIFPTVFDTAGRILYVDEVQDLSPINHLMIKRGFPGIRKIMVGDQAQAIYGFRGAHQDGMSVLKEEFKMEELKLTKTFRCARAIVEHANWRTGDMVHHREGGEVQKLGTAWTYETFPNHCAILCRNNAPILRLGVDLLKNGYTPHIIARDLFQEMQSIIRSITRKENDVKKAIAKWDEKQRKKLKSLGLHSDKVECLYLMADQANTPTGVLAYIKKLSERTHGSFTLSTCHRAKGMEWDEVFILNDNLFRIDDQASQDDNLLYVAQTRAKDKLTYIEW